MTDPFNDGEYRDEFEWEKEIRKDDDRVHDYLAELPRYIDLPDEDKVISKRIRRRGSAWDDDFDAPHDDDCDDDDYDDRDSSDGYDGDDGDYDLALGEPKIVEIGRNTSTVPAPWRSTIPKTGDSLVPLTGLLGATTVAGAAMVAYSARRMANERNQGDDA